MCCFMTGGQLQALGSSEDHLGYIQVEEQEEASAGYNQSQRGKDYHS